MRTVTLTPAAPSMTPGSGGGWARWTFEGHPAGQGAAPAHSPGAPATASSATYRPEALGGGGSGGGPGGGHVGPRGGGGAGGPAPSAGPGVAGGASGHGSHGGRQSTSGGGRIDGSGHGSGGGGGRGPGAHAPPHALREQEGSHRQSGGYATGDQGLGGHAHGPPRHGRSADHVDANLTHGYSPAWQSPSGHVHSQLPHGRSRDFDANADHGGPSGSGRRRDWDGCMPASIETTIGGSWQDRQGIQGGGCCEISNNAERCCTVPFPIPAGHGARDQVGPHAATLASAPPPPAPGGAAGDGGHGRPRRNQLSDQKRDYLSDLRRNVEHLRHGKRDLETQVANLNNQVRSLEQHNQKYKALLEQSTTNSAPGCSDNGEVEITNLHQQLSAVLLLKDALNVENLELQRRMASATDAERQELSQSTCVICMDNIANVVCLPCKHLVLCTFCCNQSSVGNCPVCCGVIAERMQVYMP